MTSKVDIGNLALAHLGAMPSITSLDPPDGGAYALHCARFYPIALSQILTHPWSFAMKRQALTLIEEDPNSQWAYSYTIPSDCIRPLHVLQSGSTTDHDGIDFIIEGNAIYCNQDEPTLLYTTSEINAASFTPLFCDALARLLAYMLSVPVMKASAGERAGLYQAFQKSMGYAASVDAMSRKQVAFDHKPAWIAGR